jgi:hypothetical protein
MLQGLYGLLLSHGKSLFVYNPFLLLAIPGAVALWRRDRATTALLAVLAVARPLFYSRWSAWYGGVAWGPRFLMPVAVPLSLLAVYAVSRIFPLRLVLRVPATLVVVALIIGAGVVNVASVWVWEGGSWNWMRYRPPGLAGAALQKFRAERHAAYFYSFRSNSIAYSLRRMRQPNRFFPLYHFRGGASPVGLAALLLAGLAPVAALVLARQRGAPPADGRSPPHPVSTPSLRHRPGAGRQARSEVGTRDARAARNRVRSERFGLIVTILVPPWRQRLYTIGPDCRHSGMVPRQSRFHTSPLGE